MVTGSGNSVLIERLASRLLNWLCMLTMQMSTALSTPQALYVVVFCAAGYNRRSRLQACAASRTCCTTARSSALTRLVAHDILPRRCTTALTTPRYRCRCCRGCTVCTGTHHRCRDPRQPKTRQHTSHLIMRKAQHAVASRELLIQACATTQSTSTGGIPTHITHRTSTRNTSQRRKHDVVAASSGSNMADVAPGKREVRVAQLAAVNHTRSRHHIQSHRPPSDISRHPHLLHTTPHLLHTTYAIPNRTSLRTAGLRSSLRPASA